MILSGNLPADDNAEDYAKAVEEAKKDVVAGVNSKGQFYAKDLKNKSSKIDLAVYDQSGDGSLYFQANDAVTVDEPQVDFFDTLQKAIDAVENGNFYPDADKNPRSFGIEGAIEAIDHVTDHVRRSHAKIGAVSNEFKLTIERTDMLKLNVQQLQSDNIDTDIGEATMKLNSLQTSYQALLASVAKINNLTLLNYL
jgi:flagellar hook-associated protein 3 FlgL